MTAARFLQSNKITEAAKPERVAVRLRLICREYRLPPPKGGRCGQGERVQWASATRY
jgi:hypothetical protein